MEEEVRANCEHILSQTSTCVSDSGPCRQALSLARSLIINPSTSETTISSIFETLARFLQPNHNPLSIHHTLSLLSDLAVQRPLLSHQIFNTVRSLALCKDNPTRTVTDALSVLVSIAEPDQTLIPSINELSEGLYVSLCFRPCASVRHWLLLNAKRFCIPPHLLLTLLLGFTKDPYPYVRRVALDGLVGLCNSIVVEDRALIEGCYWRAVELLTDMEDYVRFAAVRAVSEWGRLLVASIQDKSKRDLSDTLFVQLCSMVRDMSVGVRVEAFDALGKIGMVSEDILSQALSKKVLASTKGKIYPGHCSIKQCSTKQFEIPASSAAGAFVHGLEDEFYEVRRSACYSLRMLAILCPEVAGEALNLLMDMLNDDSIVVRLTALETMHHMAIFDCLKVQETHMLMFLGTLVDSSAFVRSVARRILRSTKLYNLAIFKLSVDGLLESLEMYQQDEGDIFSVLFNIGRSHGNFAVSIIKEVSGEIEPSCEGKLGSDSARVVALLVLAISAPLSHEQRICSIPPRIFSYAVTLLGRISCALSDVMNQNTLLAYLSHCSRSTVISAAEFNFKEEEPFLPVTEGGIPNNSGFEIISPAGMQLQKISDGASGIHSQRTWRLKKVPTPLVDYQLEDHEEVSKFVKLILSKIKDIWHLMQNGYTAEVLKMLRSWKEGLITFTTDSSADALVFMLQYLRVVKLLAKVWVHLISRRKLQSYGMGELGLVSGKLDRILREMRYRFIGFSKEEELHILELTLLNCILRLSSIKACWDRTSLKKLYSTVSRIEFLHEEGSSEPSNFVIEVKKSLFEIGASTDGASDSPILFRKLIEFFSLQKFVFCGNLKHVKAELDVHDNDYENPFPFISGLPVGIPLEISLYNISSESRLWLRMTVYEELTEFVFLDLDQFGGCDKIRKFTFVAPFYKSPKANSFTLKVCMGMECLSEDVHSFKGCAGPKHELTYLCKEKELYFSAVIKK
ncbi:hypothetical protein F0562_017766 [Nyssa sinensis]|uniref:Integrator complex subunit 4/Protein SIEL C-terminal Ig-like domain-containing protein n=1 Tax=Nyssa sinensis TaxID=561372 RepID=A0A5J4ZFN7_9ASTE|nr:hypothetical protein F0562_017766 [Nyssa sinensis]